jgi:uncharacterized protein YkwD
MDSFHRYVRYRPLLKPLYNGYGLAALVVLLLPVPQSLAAQASYDDPPALRKRANTAEAASYLSEKERAVIYYNNLARIDGAYFLRHHLKPVANEQGWASGQAYREIVRKLADLEALKPLAPDQGLSKAAAYHARQMGQRGKMSHYSQNGNNPIERTKRFIAGGTDFHSENIHYGDASARVLVVELLIDKGVRNRGHRKSMLAADAELLGVGIAPHEKYGSNCVMDFGVRQ